MKIQIIVFVLFIQQIFPSSLIAQDSLAANQAGQMPGGHSGLFLMNKKVASKTVGTTYLDDNWNQGHIQLVGGQVVENFPLKYDIKNNVIEVKSDSEIKVCPSNIVSNFYWRNKETSKIVQFVNCQDYKIRSGGPLVGFFEVVSDPNQLHKLFVKTNLVTIKPDYNVALSVGDRDTKIVKKEQYYLSNNDTVQLITKNKKKSLALFSVNEPLVTLFIKKNKLKFTKKEDLIRILAYYNTLKD